MNMRGDERNADEMMRGDMECGQNEQMNSMREERVRMMMRSVIMMKCDESENEKRIK